MYDISFSHQPRENAHLLWVVSIGYEEQTGYNINQCFSLMTKKYQPKTITLLKADDLQRHRLMANHDISENEALLESKKISSEWTLHNQEILKKFFSYGGKEISWSNILLSQGYRDAFHEVKKLYNSDSYFKSSINNLSDKFLRKIIGENPKFQIQNRKIKMNHLKNYIIEETAVMLALAVENSIYDYECYLGQRNSAMRHAYRKKVDTRKMMSIGMIKKPKVLGNKSNISVVSKMNDILSNSFQKELTQISSMPNIEERFLQEYKEFIKNYFKKEEFSS